VELPDNPHPNLTLDPADLVLHTCLARLLDALPLHIELFVRVRPKARPKHFWNAPTATKVERGVDV